MSSNKNSNSVFHKRMSDSHIFPKMNDDMFNEMVRASGLEPININMLTRVKSDLCGIVSKDKNTEEDWDRVAKTNSAMPRHSHGLRQDYRLGSRTATT